MSKVTVTKVKLDYLANCIASKSSYHTPMTLDDMAEGVLSISSGGSANLQTKSRTYTPTTSQQTESVTPDNGYDGLDAVNITVNAMASGLATPASSITATGATISTNASAGTLTLSKTTSNTPRVTAGYVSSGTAGNTDVSLTASANIIGARTLYPSTTDQAISSASYLTGTQTIKGVTTTNLTADNIKSGVTVQIGDADDSDRIVNVMGTYTGGAKNTQVVQGTTRANASTMTAIGAELTVSKTGTYDVYWSAYRNNTSSGYTWTSQLYIDGTAYGTGNTSFTNNQQNNHLTNVSLTANQKIRVYGSTTRGTSYYISAPTLVIVEA